MDKPWGAEGDQFPGELNFFGASLLRQATQKVSGLHTGADDQISDESLYQAAQDVLSDVPARLNALPETKRIEALMLMLHGMIMEHLRQSRWSPSGWQR
jgi:hypothetical protein